MCVQLAFAFVDCTPFILSKEGLSFCFMIYLYIIHLYKSVYIYIYKTICICMCLDTLLSYMEEITKSSLSPLTDEMLPRMQHRPPVSTLTYSSGKLGVESLIGPYSSPSIPSRPERLYRTLLCATSLVLSVFGNE